MCLCVYHANFIEAVSSLHHTVHSLPDYENGFVQLFVCEGSSMECWYGICKTCTGITVSKLKQLIGNSPLNSNVKWKVWKKNNEANRVEKLEECGTLDALIVHTSALSSQFLRHSFNKREQSKMFNDCDRPRAINLKFADEGLLQVDFAENFVCVQQDEVQNAHWNQRQLSLFTTGLYYNDNFQAKVFVSNNLKHTKETIVPYLFKILKELPNSLKILKIWSDGPSSQFKNKFIASLIPILEKKCCLKIVWNFFATSHGKGCVDGIGATVKNVVRNHINGRTIIVNSASDFVQAFNLTPSTIVVEEATGNDFEEINETLETVALFEKCKNIRNISNAHQIQCIDGKIVPFNTSKEGYQQISE
jgi:hypothetical protein